MAKLTGIARRERKRAPMESLSEAEIRLDGGVAFDFRGKPGSRQVSVLASGSWDAVCEEIGKVLPWTTRRANLLVEGLTFGPELVGHKICISDVVLEITDETDPCSRMKEAADGLYEALLPEWRGGVLCRVVNGGVVRLGDAVTVE